MIRKMYESSTEFTRYIADVSASHVHCFAYPTKHGNGQNLNLWLTKVKVFHYLPSSCFSTQGFRIKLSGCYDGS